MTEAEARERAERMVSEMEEGFGFYVDQEKLVWIAKITAPLVGAGEGK